MRHSLMFLLIFFAAALLFSCDPRTVFDNYSAIEPTGWNKDSVKVFQVPVKDSTVHHNIYINLRNRTSYSYNNIWLFIGISSPAGETIQDTVQFLLADPSGRWSGKGFGGVKDNRFLYRSNVYFPHAGTYLFSVRHGMRQELLPGISDIGFRVEKR